MKDISIKATAVALGFNALLFSASFAWCQDGFFSFKTREEPVQTPPPVDLPHEGPPVVQGPPLLPDTPSPPPQISEIELPFGVGVFPSYCPQDYDEIPNGTDLYKVKPVVIPGFEPAKLVVCREVVSTAK